MLYCPLACQLVTFLGLPWKPNSNLHGCLQGNKLPSYLVFHSSWRKYDINFKHAYQLDVNCNAEMHKKLRSTKRWTTHRWELEQASWPHVYSYPFSGSMLAHLGLKEDCFWELRGMMKAVWDTVTPKASRTLNDNLPCRAGQPVSGPGVAWPLKGSEEPQLFICLYNLGLLPCPFREPHLMPTGCHHSLLLPSFFQLVSSLPVLLCG